MDGVVTGVVRQRASLHRGGPGASTLMRRQLRAEKDAATVEGDVGCVVPVVSGQRWATPGALLQWARATATRQPGRWVVPWWCAVAGN